MSSKIKHNRINFYHSKVEHDGGNSCIQLFAIRLVYISGPPLSSERGCMYYKYDANAYIGIICVILPSQKWHSI